MHKYHVCGSVYHQSNDYEAKNLSRGGGDKTAAMSQKKGRISSGGAPPAAVGVLAPPHSKKIGQPARALIAGARPAS